MISVYHHHKELCGMYAMLFGIQVYVWDYLMQWPRSRSASRLIVDQIHDITQCGMYLVSHSMQLDELLVKQSQTVI